MACVALALLSVFVLPSTPSYDPWAWIVWGREIGSGAFTFATNGGPSWKPLPVVFTTVFGLFGGAAPKLWLVAARAGGLLALLGAYRLGWRLAGSVAGVLAAAALLLTHEAQGSPLIIQDWAHYLFRGASEPLLVACVLWAVEAHLARRRGLAVALAMATSLIRPEAWPFLGLYLLWLWRFWPPMRSARTLVLVAAGLVLIPLLWFGPPWISTGNPFGASTQAAHYNGQLGTDPLLEVLSRGAHLVMFPVLVFAAVAVVLGWREADRVTLWLAGGAAAWVALVALMTVAAYPGLGRFMYPPAAVACVLAGAGVVRLGGLAGSGALRWSVVAVCVGICAPFAAGRTAHAWKEKSEADLAVRFTNQLSDAVGVAGGRDRVMPCPTSVSAVNHTMQTALAWSLHVRLSRVKTVLRSPGVNFVGPHLVTIDGAAAAVRIRGGSVARLVAQSGVWRVYRVTSPRLPARCVGA
ncbi:MAG: hypothetical protein ACJ76X_06450 [Solirubrobacteraceae bacterium]